MSVSLKRRHPLWGAVPFEAALVLAALCGVLSTAFARADREAYSAALRGSRSSAPTTSVAVLTLSQATLRGGSCSAELLRTLSRSQPKGVVLLPLARELCGLGAAAELGPVRPIDLGSLRLDGAGRPVGIACSTPACFSELGIPHAMDWTSADDPASVPKLSLEDMSSGRLPSDVAHGRIVVVAMAAAAEGDAAQAVAATLAGALDGRVYGLAWSWLSGFLVALGALVIGLGERRRRLVGALLGAAAGLVVGSCAFLVLLRFQLLFPIASFSISLLASVGLASLPRALLARSAVRRASELIERATLIRSQTVDSVPDAEFWARIGALAVQAHPADEVLVAEVPAHHWHLKFWDNGNIGEGAISERRRDIRRTPYVNDQGVPMIRVVRNYLVMKDVPVLVVPLMFVGEIEGYVFLCGVAAERAFAEQPDLAARLSKDLALLLRRRRLGSPDEGAWRRSAGVRDPADRATALIEGARIALDDLKLFATMVREAPVGLLYADSFGDVRMMGKAFSRWLPSFGVQVPAAAADGLLPPGTLPVSVVLAAFAEAAGARTPPLASVADAPDGVTMRLRAPEKDGGAPSANLKLTVRALFSSAESTPSIEGYIAALIENEPGSAEITDISDAASTKSNPGLSIFSLSDLVSEVTAAASRRTGRPVRFEPPRTRAHVAGQRARLARALEEFLVDACARLGADRGPVVRIQERHNTITLSVMDLQLGLPSGALQRAVDAPSEAPDGLDALGQLVVAVEDSLGRVGLKGEDGWGATLTAGLVRARPRLPFDTTEKADAVVVELSSWKGRAAERI